MAGIIKQLAGLFTYKEPKNEELGFELLEDEKEGAENVDGAQEADSRSGKPKLKVKKCNGDLKLEVAETAESGESAEPGANAEKEEACRPKGWSDIISIALCENLATMKQKFSYPKNKDIIIREFNVGRKVKAFMTFIEGMMDKNTLDLVILPHLMAKDLFDGQEGGHIADYLIENILTVHDVRKTDKYSEVIMQVLNGISALFIEGCSECILIETRGYEKRNVEKPVTETVVKGSQEGFTENLRTNVTLIRKIVKNEKLVTEMLTVGNTNHSNCTVLYLQDIANPQVIQEVKKRLKRINSDFVLGDGMLEQFIEDNPFMLFPQTLSTERPDRAASFIMEGQVIVIGDGTPFALAVPVTFFRLFHTSEDAFVRWQAANFLRFIRIFGLFCATLLPGLYVALTLYHIEMIPTELLVSIARAKETVPFPTLLEVLIMEVSFELIREGGIRVPSIIGQTLGIVGALILGQAAVTAGLVSPMLVIVVSITGLGSFAIPNYTLALTIRMERFLFIFAGAVLGFYGIALMAVLLAYSACSMKSFGVPFFSPIAPKTKVNPDVVARYPIWTQQQRPDYMNTPNRKRQGSNRKVWISKENKDKGGQGSKEEKRDKGR